MRQFSLSANIEEGFASEAKYIVTPNARQVAEGIANGSGREFILIPSLALMEQVSLVSYWLWKET
mgnify:FL=1